MTRVTAVITAIIILSSLLIAQEDTTARKHSLYKGAWALQFAVSSNFSLQSFQNGQLSAKKQISDHSALRIGISINSRIDHRDDYEYLRYQINLSGQYLYYTDPLSMVKFYYGGGPNLNYSWDKTSRNISISGSQSWTKVNLFAVGVTGILGVEWFACESISFLAEYHASADYRYYWSRRSNNYSSTKSTSFYLDSFNARMGISLYF